MKRYKMKSILIFKTNLFEPLSDNFSKKLKRNYEKKKPLNFLINF
jgi:hypothetical protein